MTQKALYQDACIPQASLQQVLQEGLETVILKMGFPLSHLWLVTRGNKRGKVRTKLTSFQVSVQAKDRWLLPSECQGRLLSSRVGIMA